jgi:hypothetical protein
VFSAARPQKIQSSSDARVTRVGEGESMPHARDTLKSLFAHPASGNIEWREVKSLLESVGTVSEAPNGALRVTLGGETEVLRRPHGKDIDVQMVVDLRRMLTRAGFGVAADSRLR